MIQRESQVMYQYPDYLMHYGVLGMKWGRRRGMSNRAYAKSQDRASKQNWKDVKRKVKSGEIDKKSSEYKNARKTRMQYKAYKTSSGLSGYSKGSRGEDMRLRNITADNPKGDNDAYDKTMRAVRYGQSAINIYKGVNTAKLVGGVAVAVGSAYVASKYGNMNTSKLLTSGDIINLKPRQYKVRTI